MADFVNLADLEAAAERVLDPATWAYCAGGAGDEHTLGDNVEAWARHRFRPRVLADVSAVDTSTTLLGTPVGLPVGIAPTALHGRCCPDGEVATARAAARHGALLTASSLATRPLEDVAGLGPAWFQLYAHPDRGITADLLARATAAGFLAVVVTADLPVLGRRDRETRAGYVPAGADAYGNVARYGEAAAAGMHRAGLTWADLAWIREHTPLPLVLKGVLAAEDAALACEHGVEAVWVSNHGGRQLDRSVATADALEGCVAAVAGRAEVYVDGGIRRGIDVLTALALGARAAFVGRPVLYALAIGGEDGVSSMFDLLAAELANAMSLLGTPSVGAVTRAHLAT